GRGQGGGQGEHNKVGQESVQHESSPPGVPRCGTVRRPCHIAGYQDTICADDRDYQWYTQRMRHTRRTPGPQRSTPAGDHRPGLLAEVLAAVEPLARAVVVDCTIGWGGHAVELLRRAGSDG